MFATSIRPTRMHDNQSRQIEGPKSIHTSSQQKRPMKQDLSEPHTQICPCAEPSSRDNLQTFNERKLRNAHSLWVLSHQNNEVKDCKPQRQAFVEQGCLLVHRCTMIILSPEIHPTMMHRHFSMVVSQADFQDRK